MSRFAANAAHALMRFVGDGMRQTSPSEELNRAVICEGCPLNVGGSCAGCGCIIDLKVKSRLEQCPAGKWYPDVHEVRPLEDCKRNLICFLLPVAGNDNWKWNLRRLAKRVDLFNGKKVLAIAFDDTDRVEGRQTKTVNADDVILYSECIGIKWDRIEAFPNSATIGEAVAFKWLLESVKSTEPNEVTYYCHGKGVTRPEFPITLRWAEQQHHVCLDDWASVQNALERFSMCGAFRQFGAHVLPDNHRWHYSGTFFWFRNDDVFNNLKWNQIDQVYFGVEAWPGKMFQPEHSACIFGDNTQSPYLQSTWDNIAKDIEIWDKSRPAIEVDSEKSISIIVPTLGRESLKSIVNSLRKQIGLKDEIIIVADGADARMRAEAILGQKVFEHHADGSKFGNTQRRFGASLAKCDLLWFVDDDDHVDANAVKTIKATVTDKPVLFRMKYCGTMLPNGRNTELGNVSGQMLVVPNSPNIPQWEAGDNYRADNEWIKAVESACGMEWSDDVIYEIVKHNQGQ
jgi:hypothetical protein